MGNPDTERFQVAPIWASLAHWLAWAMDAANAGHGEDAAYNLSQFWRELESWKQTQLHPAEWGDLGRMDAISNLVLATIATSEIHDAMEAAGSMSKLSLVNQILSPPMGLLALLGLDPSRMTLEAYVRALQKRRKDAARNALDLANRATEALESAGLDTAPARSVIESAQAVLSTIPDLEREEGFGVVTSTPSWGTVAADAATGASRTAGEVVQEALGDTIPNILRSVPWWAWVAMAGALVLIPALLAPRITVGRE
jgi:hypothetical protein